MNNYLNVTLAFESMFHEITNYGEDFAGTKALFNQSFTVTNVSDKVIKTPERKFKQSYADYEWSWYLTGNRDAREISEKASIWKNMMVPGTNEVNSNYGYFWKFDNQLDRIMEELRKNPESRRAVVVHYDPNELDRYQYDTPCNLVLNFYLRKGKLYLTVFARSIDLVYGFCNDFYTFAKLMELVANRLEVKLGDMCWHITNLHVYPRHYTLFEK